MRRKKIICHQYNDACGTQKRESVLAFLLVYNVLLLIMSGRCWHFILFKSSEWLGGIWDSLMYFFWSRGVEYRGCAACLWNQKEIKVCKYMGRIGFSFIILCSTSWILKKWPISCKFLFILTWTFTLPADKKRWLGLKIAVLYRMQKYTMYSAAKLCSIVATL